MYLPRGDPREIAAACRRLTIPEDSVVLLLLAGKSKSEIVHLIELLNKKRINFCGGIFPGIIHGDRKYDEGAIIIILPALEKPFLIKEINTTGFILPDFQKMPGPTALKKPTVFIFVDGWASHISLFLTEIFNQLGNSVNYFGGGAGPRSLKQQPCIFNPEGLFRDAGLVLLTKMESKLGVSHGWKRLTGPIIANRTQNHIVIELNWEQAFEIYRRIVESSSGKKLTRRNFYKISQNFPFGLSREEAEDVVRDPIAVNKKRELICVGEIPENSVLHILKGEKNSLLRAARAAAAEAGIHKKKKPACCLVADCISRSLFLGADFQNELKIVKNGIAPRGRRCISEGILSIGEISSSGEGYLEFFNKTIVVGSFYEV